MTAETNIRPVMLNGVRVTIGSCFSELSLVEELLFMRDCGAELNSGPYAGIASEGSLGIRFNRLPDEFEPASRPLFHPWYPTTSDGLLCLEALKRRFAVMHAWGTREETPFPYMSDTLSLPQDYDSPDQACGWGSIFLLGGWQRKLDDQHYIRPPTYLGQRVECRVFTKLVYAILGDDVLVDSGATVVRSIVRDGCQIRSHAVIADSIIGRNVVIGDRVVIEHRSYFKGEGLVPDFRRGSFIHGYHWPKLGACVGDGCIVGTGAILRPGVGLGPGIEVPRLAIVPPGFYPTQDALDAVL